jgi:hypothetical protein
MEGKDSCPFAESLIEFGPQIVDEGQHQAAIPWPLTNLKQPSEERRLPGSRPRNDDPPVGVGADNLSKDSAEFRFKIWDHPRRTLGSQTPGGKIE